jgi:hypothetical protein
MKIMIEAKNDKAGDILREWAKASDVMGKMKDNRAINVFTKFNAQFRQILSMGVKILVIKESPVTVSYSNFMIKDYAAYQMPVDSLEKLKKAVMKEVKKAGANKDDVRVWAE